MALLHKIRILENERIDKPDHDQIQEFVADDFKAYNRHFFTDADKWITKGFIASVTSGLNISVTVQNSSLFNTEASGEDEFYLGESGHAALTTTLTDNSTNYVHLEVVSGNTGTSATRVFWDPSLNSGAGGEFLQAIDTEEYLDVQLSVNTSGFSSDANKIPLCTMVTVGGSVTSIIDNRNLYFRLGKGQTLNSAFEYTLTSPSEPASSSFTGGDKDISSFKDWMDLVMTRIKNVSGETSWFVNTGGFNVIDLYNDLGMIMTGGGTIGYTAGNVFNFSADLKLDVISSSVTYTIPFATESGQTLADGQVAYINIDAELGGASAGKRGVSGNRDLVIANRSSVPFTQDIYWIAYRTGAKLFVRGMRQELEQGEESQIGDGISADLLAFIGSTGETDNSPNYPSNNIVVDGTSLVTAIGALDTFSLNYLLKDGTRSMTGALNMNSHQINNVTDPTSAQDAVTVAYYNAHLPAAGITDHGALTGLGDDDHPQYGALAQNETVTGAWTFNANVNFDFGTFFVDATNNRTYFGATATTTIAGSSYTRQLIASGTSSCDARITTGGGALGVVDSAWHNSASPAIGDIIYEERYYGNNDTGVIKEYAFKHISIDSPTTSTENGVYELGIIQNGTATTKIKLTPSVNEMSGDFSFDSGVTISSDLTVDTDTFLVDAGSDRIYIGRTAANSIGSAKVDIKTTGNTALHLESNSLGTGGVLQRTYANSNSPAVNDNIFDLQMYGNSNTLVAREYARIVAEAVTVTNGSEDGRLTFQAMCIGSLNSFMVIDGSLGGSEKVTFPTGLVPGSSNAFDCGSTNSHWQSVYAKFLKVGASETGLISAVSDVSIDNLDGASASGINISTSQEVFPSTDNTHSLGYSSFRWKDVWAVDSSINTSDERHKDNIEDSDLGLHFLLDLRPIKYKRKDYTSQGTRQVRDKETGQLVEETFLIEHKHKRAHYGFPAQQVERSLNGKDFAGVVYDADEDLYGLRLEEFIAPTVKAIHEIYNDYITPMGVQLNELTSKITALEARLN